MNHFPKKKLILKINQTRLASIFIDQTPKFI